MSINYNQVQEQNARKSKESYPLSQGRGELTEEKSKKAGKLKMESAETNKKLVRRYGQEIKEKVNVINSLIDKIAKN